MYRPFVFSLPAGLVFLLHSSIWAANPPQDGKAAERSSARSASSEYIADLHKVKPAWEALDFATARQLLDKHRPSGREGDRGPWEWQYWNALVPGKELRCLGTIPDRPHLLAWTPNGRMLAGTLDGTNVKVWDAETGQLVPLDKAPSESAIAALAWSPDGKLLAVAREDGSLSVLDRDKRRQRLALPAAPASRISGKSIAWSSDSLRLAIIDADRKVGVWNVGSHSDRPLLGTLGHEITAIAWSPDGRVIASDGPDECVTFWDARSFKELSRVPGLRETIVALAWRPGSQEIATLRHAGELMNPWDIRVHRASDGKERLHVRQGRAFDSPADPCLKWSRDGSRVGFVDSSRAVAWDAASGAVLGVSASAPAWLQPQWLRSDTAPPVDPELRRFAFGHSILDLQTSTELDSLTELEPGTLNPLGWSPDGGRIVLCTRREGESKEPRNLFVWLLPSAAERERIWPVSETRQLLWSPDRRRLRSMSEGFPERGIPDVIRIGDVARRQWTIAKLSLPPSTAWVTFGEMSPRGDRLAIAYSDGNIRMTEVATGKVRAQFAKHADQTLPEEGIRVLSFSPSGAWLASVDVDSRVFVWNTATGAERWGLDLGGRWNGFPPQIAWTPDEKYLAILFHDGSDFRISDAATGRELLSRHFAEPVVSFGWRPEGQQLALIQGDETKAILWDWKSNKSEEIANGAWGMPAWSPDGKALALGQLEQRFRGKLRLWRPGDQTFLALPYEASMMPGQGRSFPIAWSADSGRLAILDDRGALKIFDAHTAKEVPTDLTRLTRDQSAWGFALAWTAAGLRMAISKDSDFEIWDTGKGQPALRLAKRPSKPQFRDPNSPRFVDAVWSPDGQRLAAADSLGRVAIYDASAGQFLAMLSQVDEDDGFNPLLAWSPDGRTLAIARGETIDLCDTASWKRSRQLGPGRSQPARRQPETLGQMLQRQERGGREAPTFPIRWLGWDPQGRRLAALSAGPPLNPGTSRRAQQIVIFDARSGGKESVVTNKDMDDPDPDLIRRAAWSPDGKRIALAGSHGVPVWDVATGKEVYRLRVAVSQFEAPRLLGELFWSADGTRLIAQNRMTRARPNGPGLGPSALLRVWDTSSHEELLILTGAAANLLFSPDGRWMYTGSLVKSAP